MWKNITTREIASNAFSCNNNFSQEGSEQVPLKTLTNVPWFLLRIFWCSQSGNHPENNLAKFGYIIDMKVEKNIGSFYILGYLLEVIVRLWQFQIFEFQNLANLGHLLFPWKIPCVGRNHICQVEIWRESTSKRNTEPTSIVFATILERPLGAGNPMD
jgi:hypothetical protein